MPTRADIYEAGGLILAGTGNRIGIPLVASDQMRWGQIMRGLVTYDDLSEADSSQFEDDPTSVLGYLGLDPTDNRLKDHAHQLVVASQAADLATTIPIHYEHRKIEAVSCANLLRYSCDPNLADAYDAQWDQIARLSVAGIFWDSTRDAREDAETLSQFNERQLAFGGLWRAGRTMMSIRPETWAAFVSNMRDQGLNMRLRHLARFFAEYLSG